jgi:flagellar hook-associated protein 1 FlgK
MGVTTDGVQRSAERLVNEQLVDAIGNESRSSTAYQTLSAIETYLDEESTASVANRLDAFFDDLSSLASDPGDASMRDASVDSAEALTNSVRQLSEEIRDSRDSIQAELEDTMIEIQQKIDQVADLNSKLADSSTLTGGDYADRASALVSDLAEAIGATAHFELNGTVTLFLGGHAVVTGAEAREITVGTDTSGNPKITLSSDSAFINITSQVGGRFGGLLDADDELVSAQTNLETFADTCATDFNAVHSAGLDLTGTAGNDFFTFTAGSAATSLEVTSAIIADSGLMALGASTGTGAAGDGLNLTDLLALEDTDAFTTGTKTPGEFLSSIYRDIGAAVREFELDLDSYGLEMADLQELRDSISAVDLDEEAADLLAWQAAYQASARVISAASDLLNELMGIV